MSNAVTSEHDAPEALSLDDLAASLANAIGWRCTHQGAFSVDLAPAGARNGASLWVAQLDAQGNEDGVHELTVAAAELAISALWQVKGQESIAFVGRVLARAVEAAGKAAA